MITITSTTATGQPKIKVIKKNTYLSLYGSGFSYPGDTHGLGNGLKLVAQARNIINKATHPKDICEVKFCPTDSEFFNAINSATNIKRLDIYSHGWIQGLNLGGFEGTHNGETRTDSSWRTDEGSDLRQVTPAELSEIKPSVFSDDVKVYFWGCNIGGQLDNNDITNHILSNDHARGALNVPRNSFAQVFAVTIGKGKVYALVGKGAKGAGSMFKQDANGNNVYESGELLPANISFNNNHKNTHILKAMDYMKQFPL